MRKAESGFSVLELSIVLVIVLIITGIAVPAFMRTAQNYRLDTTGRSIAETLREAQMKASQTNQPYYAQFGGPCGTPAAPNRVCAVPAARLVPFTLNPGDPVAYPAEIVIFNAVPGPGAGPPNLGGALQPAGALIGFNARGMPCTNAGNPNVCAPGVSFEWFMQSAGNGAWEAVTVTAAGRIRSWRQDGAVWR